MIQLDSGNQIAAEDYHDLPGVSHSRLKDFIDDPRIYYWHHILGKRQPRKTHFDVGSAVHDILLLGDEAAIVAIPPDVLSASGSRAGKRWKEFEEEHADKLLLKQDEYDNVRRICDAVMNNDVAGKLLGMPGPAEHAWWHDDKNLELRLKCRPDKIAVKADTCIGIDLKTTSTGTVARKFVNSVANYGYHTQEYFYRRVLGDCGIKLQSFVFIAVSVDPPYTVDCFRLSREFLSIAQDRVELALGQLAERHELDDWLMGGSIVELSPPKWLHYQGEYEV